MKSHTPFTPVAANNDDYAANDAIHEPAVSRESSNPKHPAYDLLDKDQVAQLWADYKNGSAVARNQLLLANQRLVMKCIRDLPYVDPNDADDLFQQGHLALHAALGTFDPEKGSFGTHAYRRIKESFGTWHSKAYADVYVPQSARKFRDKARKLVNKLNMEGRENPRADAARELGVPVDAIDSMLALKRKSLQTPRQAVNDADAAQTLQDTLADVSAQSQHDVVSRDETSRLVDDLLAGLKAPEALVLRFFYGIAAHDCNQSFAEVARHTGMTREGARKAYQRGMKKLEALSEDGRMPEALAALA